MLLLLISLSCAAVARRNKKKYRFSEEKTGKRIFIRDKVYLPFRTVASYHGDSVHHLFPSRHNSNQLEHHTTESMTT